MKEFEGKTAVITGGASGIGRAMAELFLSRGMNVVLGDIEQQALDKAGLYNALLVEGKPNKEIADALVISPATVRVYVSNILAKLNANNRTEAASLALQHRLVADSPRRA